jgi:hypothetical protein
MTRNAASKSPGRLPPFSFVDANNALRKNSMLPGGVHPANHLHFVGTSVPPFVRSACGPGDRLTRTGEMWLSAGHLISHPSTDNLHGLFLEVMHVQRRTGARLRHAVNAHPLACRSLGPSGKGDELAVAVVDRVRVGFVHHYRPLKNNSTA